MRGPDGKPLADARIIAWAEQPDVPEKPADARTDATGQFHVAIRSSGPLTVRVEARALASRTIRHVRRGTPLAVVLARGVAITGVVRDGTAGSPVAGATIEAREDTARLQAALPWDSDSGVVRITTDAKGAYRLDGLASGLYTLTAFARGLGRGDRRNVLAGRNADLILLPGSSVTGVVTSGAGKPLDAVAVRMVAATPFTKGGPFLATTDKRGLFAVHGVAPGEYRIFARHPDFALALSSVIADRDGEAHADLVMTPPVTIRGRLLGTGGKPVRGVVGIRERAGVPLSDVLDAQATDDDGVFRISTGPGVQVVEVASPGYGSRRIDTEVGSTGDTIDLGDVTLEVGITIRGHVQDGAGQAVEGAVVSTYSDERATFSARTDAGGFYVLAGLTAGGLYDVHATAAGLGEADRKAEPGATGVDLVLPGAGMITGSVVDDAGHAVQGFRVTARLSRASFGRPRMEAFGAADGRFVLEDLVGGEYVVEVTAPDRAAGVVPGVKVVAGGSVDVGTVRLGGGGTVRGLVVDSSSAPVVGATVTVSGPGRDGRIPPQVTTDAGGAFEIGGIAVGTVQVSAVHPSYAPSAATAADVDPARGPSEVRIVLVQGGRIEGQVRAREGALPAGAVVNVYSTVRSASSYAMSSPPIQPVSADGSFAVDHVPAGNVAVALMVGQGGQYHSAAQVQTTVREGETTPVELVVRTIAITGRVTRGGAPLAGARVEFHSSHSGSMYYGSNLFGSLPPFAGVTREDGTYQLSVSEPGEARVDIQTPDGRGRLPAPVVVVPDADTYVADFSFSGVPVDGTVVDRDTERPIAGAGVWAQPVTPGPTGVGGGAVEADTQGRFHIETEPGDYRITARADGYGGDAVAVTVGESGSTGLRIPMVQGLAITGRVVDLSGRAVSGVSVSASAGEATNRSSTGATSLADGSFQLSGLRESSYLVVARIDGGLYGIATNVTPSSNPITLTLRPGGRVRVRVVDAAGAAVPGALVGVGYLGSAMTFGGAQADGEGMAEVPAPVGAIEVRAATLGAASPRLMGTASVRVSLGGLATVEVMVKPMENR